MSAVILQFRRAREPWQQARCPYHIRGKCIANHEAACLCQNGERAYAIGRAFLPPLLAAGRDAGSVCGVIDYTDLPDHPPWAPPEGFEHPSLGYERMRRREPADLITFAKSGAPPVMDDLEPVGC